MSTRGTAYFEIQESISSNPIKIGRIGIPRDGYHIQGLVLMSAM